MSNLMSSDIVKNSPKTDKYKANSLLFMMNGAFEKNMMSDVSEMSSIFQARGFKLVHTEKTNNNELENKDENELRITVSCGRSGINAIFTKQDYVCNCQEDINNAQNICENGIRYPLTKLQRRHSNLAKELLSSLMAQKEIKNDTKENNEDFQTPVGPDVISDHGSTWEVDPKTSPPVMTSSPLTESNVETCTLCLDKEQKISEIIDEAKNQIIKALALLPKKNNTFTKKKFKRVSDIPKLPNVIDLPNTPSTPKCNFSYEIKTTVKRMVTPKKISPKKIALGTPVKNKTPKFERKIFSPKRTILKYSSPMQNKSSLERKSRLDTPVPKIYKSPISKPSKLVKTSIPKFNNVVSSSTSSLIKSKTSIPTYSKFNNIKKTNY